VKFVAKHGVWIVNDFVKKINAPRMGRLG
jgi:hypothetical protein